MSTYGSNVHGHAQKIWERDGFGKDVGLNEDVDVDVSSSLWSSPFIIMLIFLCDA